MPLQEEKLYTVQDIYSLPEGERAELTDGQIFPMALPDRKHQEITGGLHVAIAIHIRQNGGACKVYESPFAVFLTDDDTTYVEPDVSVICDPRKLDDRGCRGAPDWIIEVVSPSSRSMDYIRKTAKYQTAGVREYWIVDPSAARVTAWDLPNTVCCQYAFTDTVPSILFPGLSIRLADFLL